MTSTQILETFPDIPDTQIKSSLICIRNTKLLTNLHHLAQLGQVASDEVEEGKFVKVLGPLVAHFNYLVVTLQQCCLTQTLPAAALIQSLGCLQSHLKYRERCFSFCIHSISQLSRHYCRLC